MKRGVSYLRLALLVCGITGVFSMREALAQKEPLSLPEDFDYELYMPAHTVDGKLFHSAKDAAEWCARLLENGTAEDIQHAEKIVPGLLSCQETDPASPHYGAFRWELETPVEDLNAVEFVMFALIPMMIQQGHLLSPDVQEKLRGSIRMAMENIRNIDVHHKYTNIVIKDITNTCLGGELLNDPVIAQRGYDKLRAWMQFTDASGGNYEFNSPYYTYVAVNVMSTLNRFVKDEETRVRSEVVLGRISLSAFLHVHTPTGRLAGPHGRAYHHQVTGGGEAPWMKRWVDNGMAPSWVDGLVNDPTWPDQVTETSGRAEGIFATTYKTADYSFGVASRNMFNQDIVYIAWQSNVFTIHYKRPGKRQPGILYTRYVLDDKWLGDFSPGPGRGNTGLIPDVGHFQGVQDKERAIGLYIPRSLGGMERHHSAKAVIALPHWDPEADRLWIDGILAGPLPMQAGPTSVVVIESGDIFMAFRPFSLTDLGGNTGGLPVTVKEYDGNLMIELFNYRGPEKTFWELAWPGTFFQGHPQCGFYCEIASQKDYADGAAFGEKIVGGTFTDVSDPESTYSGTETRKWRVAYSREGRSLGLEVDLFDWFRSSKRWTEDGHVQPAMLDSKFARQDTSGTIRLGETELRWNGEGTAWLYRSPEGDKIAAAYHGPDPSSFILEDPSFSLQIPRVDCGIAVWENGEIRISALGMSEAPKIEGATLSQPAGLSSPE
jgi:hypothetical protein